MKPARLLFLALFAPGLLAAQQLSHPVMASRDDASVAPRTAQAFPDTVRVLAVMVQFQTDTDERTTGNGRFDLTSPATPYIDAPPRNAHYFRDHLLFLNRYFDKASKGRVIVRSTLLDSVFTLPTAMGSYSPPKNGSNVAVANLARDTWRLVDASGNVPDFSAYNCFVVFHAGAGRDVDLVGTLGYDPTPLDIPSLYLGPSAFTEFFGQPGISLRNGTFLMGNTIVVPETENRLLPGVTGDVPLQLGINGMLCASLGNFLGLPDLFDTKTGASGIGRFGLMDGQSIFSFNGAFPPEPSAWEKYWLGWITPIIVPAGATTLSIPAASIADSIYRIPISAQEYYLLENRNRDPERHGLTITTSYAGVVTTQTFLRDTVGFDAFDLSQIRGTVTGVSNPDWSLPGTVDADGTFYDGGLLIWHIDEAQIARTIGANQVNADPKHRGVDLEEADGSQDIGQQYGMFSAGSGSEAGTPLDYWYQGNSSPVYKNSFSATSHPPSVSYNGAATHIEVSEFSSRGPRMSAQVVRGSGGAVPLNGFPKILNERLASHALTVGPLGSLTTPAITVVTSGIPPAFRGTAGGSAQSPRPGSIYAWTVNGDSALRNFSSSGLVARGTNLDAQYVDGAALFQFPAGGKGSVVPKPHGLDWFSMTDTNNDSLADMHLSQTLAGSPSTSVSFADSMVAFGTALGVGIIVRTDGTLVDSLRITGNAQAAVAGVSLLPWVNINIRPSNYRVFIFTGTDGSLRLTDKTPGTSTADITAALGHPIVGPAVAAAYLEGTTHVARIAVATTDGYLFLLDAQLHLMPGFPVFTGGAITEPPAFADVNVDGVRDIIVFSGGNICAYNHAGISLDNFPVVVSTSSVITSAPVIADLDADGLPDIVAVTSDGLVAAVNRTGGQATGFPLLAGTGAQSAAAFVTGVSGELASRIGLAVASSDAGTVSAWLTGVVPAAPVRDMLPWPQYMHDQARQGNDVSSTGPAVPLSTEFFPKGRVYNWPNPVYDGITHIRYFVREDATVRIKIFDLAGDLVTDLSGPGVGGVDNEVAWNVASVQSGVYFAHVEAVSQTGSAVAIIKVAVVK